MCLHLCNNEEGRGGMGEEFKIAVDEDRLARHSFEHKIIGIAIITIAIITIAVDIITVDVDIDIITIAIITIVIVNIGVTIIVIAIIVVAIGMDHISEVV